MRNLRTWTLFPLLALLALGLPGCNGESPTLDDPDDANSVLEVLTITPPTANAAGDISLGTCVITIANVTATLANKAKSIPAAGSPFNDITLLWVDAHYTWDDPTLVTPDRRFNIGGTVPIGGTQAVQFGSIAFGDFTGAMQGHSVNMHFIFHGIAVSGEPVSAQAGVTMGVGGVCSF
ncbi:MAG TPA: hypothetical protein VFV75_14285 [Candidatus Polarisedimenticolaceae bacterium]|nr:hypothetical protein [Candidatus Polarisedimenticolaceae bacterium]HEX5044073.1 hypothetical protein [Candidatus Polarisedimenticolaceae bacterium]